MSSARAVNPAVSKKFFADGHHDALLPGSVKGRKTLVVFLHLGFIGCCSIGLEARANGMRFDGSNRRHARYSSLTRWPSGLDPRRAGAELDQWIWRHSRSVAWWTVFSKKVENLAHAVSLHFAHYNLRRPHQTLNKAAGTKTTPAMAAGVEKYPWSLTQLCELLED